MESLRISTNIYKEFFRIICIYNSHYHGKTNNRYYILIIVSLLRKMAFLLYTFNFKNNLKGHSNVNPMTAKYLNRSCVPRNRVHFIIHYPISKNKKNYSHIFRYFFITLHLSTNISLFTLRKINNALIK